MVFSYFLSPASLQAAALALQALPHSPHPPSPRAVIHPTQPMLRQLFSVSWSSLSPPLKLHGCQNTWGNLGDDVLQEVKDGTPPYSSNLPTVLANFE